VVLALATLALVWGRYRSIVRVRSLLVNLRAPTPFTLRTTRRSEPLS
jgi:hypothetical protein